MRGFGRVVAAVLLTGAVAGTAAFAHLLGSEPAGPSSVATLPPAPTAPLVVQADPWSPVLKVRLGAALARPTGLPTPTVPVIPADPRRQETPSHHLTSIVRIAPHAPRAKVAAEPTPVAAPAAAPTVAAPAPAATQTVAAPPVAAPTVTVRELTTATTPAPVTAVPTTTTTAATTTPPKHQRNEHGGGNQDKSGHGHDSDSGDSRSSDSKSDSSGAILSSTPVAAPQPVATPQPVVSAPLPSVDPPADPPAVGSTWSQPTKDDLKSVKRGDDSDIDGARSYRSH